MPEVFHTPKYIGHIPVLPYITILLHENIPTVIHRVTPGESVDAWKKSLVLSDQRDTIFHGAREEEKKRSSLVSRAVQRYPAALSIHTGTFPFPSFAIVHYNKLRVLTSLTGAHCTEVKKHDLSDAIRGTKQPRNSQSRQNTCE